MHSARRASRPIAATRPPRPCVPVRAPRSEDGAFAALRSTSDPSPTGLWGTSSGLERHSCRGSAKGMVHAQETAIRRCSCVGFHPRCRGPTDAAPGWAPESAVARSRWGERLAGSRCYSRPDLMVSNSGYQHEGEEEEYRSVGHCSACRNRQSGPSCHCVPRDQCSETWET